MSGTRLSIVPFSDEPEPPMGQPLGAELDGRLFSDLSGLTPNNAVTRTENFYVRTRASKLLPATKSWTIQLGGQAANPSTLSAQALDRLSRPMGLHLMECVGNTRSAHFGMLSVADWDGVGIDEILDSAKWAQSGARILVSGFDQYASESRTSVAGASWIFTREQLLSARAFLATKMNGQHLTADHGAPVRLVVPGWYGCACIKWVNEIALVPEASPATSQMQEYAGRTRQTGVPALAAEYRAAMMDIGALPVRVEKWLVDGKVKYRVAGIQWGGTGAIEGLQIRFNAEETYVDVEDFHSSGSDACNFWSHTWVPEKPGKYVISLCLKGPNAAARRLDSGYYNRSIEITEA